MLTERDKLWNQVLVFLLGEFFGPETVELLASHKFNGDSIAKNEKQCDVLLNGFEKRMYDCVDVAFCYLQENGYKMPKGEGEERRRLAVALKEIFWALVKLNHPELLQHVSRSHTSIGIRKGYSIVYFEDKRSMILENLLSTFGTLEEEEDE